MSDAASPSNPDAMDNVDTSQEPQGPTAGQLAAAGFTIIPANTPSNATSGFTAVSDSPKPEAQTP